MLGIGLLREVQILDFLVIHLGAETLVVPGILDHALLRAVANFLALALVVQISVLVTVVALLKQVDSVLNEIPVPILLSALHHKQVALL